MLIVTIKRQQINPFNHSPINEEFKMKTHINIIMKKRICMAFAGNVLTGIGVGILKSADLGIDPFNSLVTGAMNFIGLSYNPVYLTVSGLLLIATFLMDRHYIGLSTILNFAIIGPIVEVTQSFTATFFSLEQMNYRVLFLFAGIVLTAFAGSIYVTADLGVSGYDAMSLIAADRLPVPFRFCRMTADLLCILIGFSCGSTIGIGTVITALCFGPIIDLFCKHVTKPYLYGRAATETVISRPKSEDFRP